MAFTHLHVHTEHSFLDGVPTLPDLVSRVVELGQGAVAMTDHGEVSGHLKFQKAAQAGGITPVFGIETYFVDDVSMKSKETMFNYGHMTVLALNQKGLENVWKLSSRAWMEGFYKYPRIDWNILRDHSEGIVATGGCLGGCVASYVNPKGKRYDRDEAESRLGRFMEILGDRFYLELHTLPDDEQHVVNKTLVEMASMYNVPLIAVSDSHYLRPEDWEGHELLIAAQMGKKWNSPDRFTYGYKPDGGGNGYGALHVLHEDEVWERLSSHLPPDVVRTAMENTVAISDEVKDSNIQIEGQRTYPVFFAKTNEDVDKLKVFAWEQFDKRVLPLGLSDDKVQEYRERLERELSLVVDKGYAGYFLIVSDAVRAAKAKGLLIGPGRGSAGGSLLSYVLEIIEVDPVANDLLFERFLDPNLKQLPDIDIDVPQQERSQVIEYLRNKYETAVIGTLITQGPRLLLRDFCRVLSIPQNVEEAIGKIISGTKDLTVLDLTWPQVCEANAEAFAPWMKKQPKLFELMDRFYSHYRHHGGHAAALVVNREPLLGRLPLRQKDQEVRTQFDMHDVEELGFMKMDWLGLRNLSTLMRAREMAAKSWTPDSGKPEPKPFYEWQYEWDTYYNDLDVYKSLWDGKNLGIFQIETEGFTQVVKRYLPTSIEDMCAVVSLFRPGITRAVDDETGLNLMELMLQKREGRQPVSYRHPLLEPILGSTYGAFLYQEQIMQTVRDIGGFDAAEQSRIRKIIGKTKPEDLKTFKDTFVERATEKGVDLHTAEAIWNDMESFGVYGFNKSHGFAYGMIAYWTAWMKHHYTGEFLTALFQTDEENIKAYNRECRRLGIALLGPDVNESEANFAFVNGRIRYGLHGVRNVGRSAEVIYDRRPFSSVRDLMEKCDKTSANKKVLESLIAIGALDSIVTAEDRYGIPADWSNAKAALWGLHRYKLKIGPRKDAGLDEAGIIAKYRPEFEEYATSLNIDDLDTNEPYYLGEHVTTMPFGQYLPNITEHYRYPGFQALYVDEEAVIGGLVGVVEERKVKKEGPNKGRPMGWVWLEFPVIQDGDVIDIESRKLVCFPKEWTYLSREVEAGVPVIVKVTKLADKDGFEGGLCLQSVYRIDRGEFPGMHSLIGARVSADDDPTQEPGYWDA